MVVSYQPLLVDAGGAHVVLPQRYLAAKTISAPIREIHRCAIAAWIDCVPDNPLAGIEVPDTMSELKTASAVEQAEPVTPDAIMQLGLAFWGSKTLLSAVEMRLFAVLSEAGPLGAEELRERLGLHPRGARDFFDALVALGMLERNEGRYSNTPATELFLDPAKPSYMGGILEMANARLYPFWGSLTEGLRTGKPQSEAKTGGDFFAAVYADPQAGAIRPRDERAQRPHGPGDRGQVPVARPRQRDRHRLRRGRCPGRDRACARAYDRRRLRPASN